MAVLLDRIIVQVPEEAKTLLIWYKHVMQLPVIMHSM